jgi:hypothetical protein
MCCCDSSSIVSPTVTLTNQGRVIKALIDGKADASNFRSSTAVRFKDITGFPSIFDPVPTSFNYSALINQWVNSVVASSQFSGVAGVAVGLFSKSL